MMRAVRAAHHKSTAVETLIFTDDITFRLNIPNFSKKPVKKRL
jgi:hypothetical protein